jgi:hypothetical protein
MNPNENPPQDPQPRPAQGYQTVPAQPTNGMAVAGLIFAFIFPLIGLILSIIGLNKAKNHNGNGRSLAIAGIVVSSVMTLLSLLIVPALVITTISSVQRKAKEAEQTSTSSSENASVDSVKLGSTYTEKSGAYSMKLPKDWKAAQAEGSRNISVVAPFASKDYVSSISVSIDKLYTDETLADFVSSEKESITKYSGGIIKSEADVAINGLAGHEIVASQDTGGSVYSTYTVMLTSNGSVYRLEYRTSPERSDKYLPVFKESAKSFIVK